MLCCLSSLCSLLLDTLEKVPDTPCFCAYSSVGTMGSFCVTVPVECSLTSNGFSLYMQMSSFWFIFPNDYRVQLHLKLFAVSGSRTDD